MTKYYIYLFIYIINFILILRIILRSISLNNKWIHPTSIGTILILFRLILSINLRIFFKNHWFSYIIFLTIIRGIIILFIYFIRFINNIKILIKLSSYFNILIINLSLIIIFFIIYYLYNKNFLWFNFNELNNNWYIIKNNLLNNFIKINFIYYYNKNISTIISIIYLFFCLTIIVKICIINKYSIRKIN